MRLRRASHAAGLVALAAMLFGQAALALACDLPRHAPSQALMPVQQGLQSEPCPEPTESKAWCLAHCKRADQTFDKPQVEVPEFQAAMVRPAGEPPRSPGLASLRVPVAIGPPRRILFQSFLI